MGLVCINDGRGTRYNNSHNAEIFQTPSEARCVKLLEENVTSVEEMIGKLITALRCIYCSQQKKLFQRAEVANEDRVCHGGMTIVVKQLK